MGVGDIKGDECLFYAEAFKAYRGEGEKAGKETRLVLFGKGKSLTEAGEEMRNTVNYPIEYAGSKSFVFSLALAEHGLEDVLDIFNRDQKPSLREYLFVYDKDVEELLNVTMVDEQFMGLFLYELMNSQKSALGVITNQYYQFIENLHVGSNINVVPILLSKKIAEESGTVKKQGLGDSSGGQGGQGGQSQQSPGNQDTQSQSQGSQSGQSSKPVMQPYVAIDGAAVFVGSKMMARMDAKDAEAYKLVKGSVKSGLINIPNPSYTEKNAGFSILDNDSKCDVKQVGDRYQADCRLHVRAVLVEVEQGIDVSDPAVMAQLKSGLESEIANRLYSLFQSMRDKGVDIFNVKREMQLNNIRNIPDDFLSKVDFTVRMDVIVDGVGIYRNAYY